MSLLPFLKRVEKVIGIHTWKKDSIWSKKSDFRGVEIVKGSFGGMGSFNDLIIHPMNKHSIKESEVESINKDLNYLRSKIYNLCQHIIRNADIKNHNH